MADLEITLKKINTKLQMLQITRNECPRILQQNKIRKLEKHLQMFEECLEEVYQLKGKIQELKLEQEEVQEYNAPIEKPQSRTMELKKRESQERKAEVDQVEEERLQRRYNKERKLEQ